MPPAAPGPAIRRLVQSNGRPAIIPSPRLQRGPWAISARFSGRFRPEPQSRDLWFGLSRARTQGGWRQKRQKPIGLKALFRPLGHGGFVFDQVFLPLLLSHAYKDKDGQEAVTRASSLDWVIVRPAMLTNDPARGSVTDLAGVNGARLHAPMSLGSWWSN